MALQGLRRNYPNLLNVVRRSIMTSSWNSAKAQEELEKNPYFDKYAAKIKKLQTDNQTEYLARLKGNEERKTEVKVPETKPRVEYPEPRKAGTFKRRQLADIMNVDLLKGKSSEEVDSIWKEYYCNKDDVIYGSITRKEFDSFIPNCRQYPTFVIPLPRGDGFEFFMVQFHENEFHVTPLILYHKYKEESPESLCVSYFPDLPQDLVLILGEYDKKMLSPIEAQCLLNSLQLFYNSKDRLKFVKRFNESPQTFDHNDLIREINSLSLEKQ